jgi:hypothetical protein
MTDVISKVPGVATLAYTRRQKCRRYTRACTILTHNVVLFSSGPCLYYKNKKMYSVMRNDRRSFFFRIAVPAFPKCRTPSKVRNGRKTVGAHTRERSRERERKREKESERER